MSRGPSARIGSALCLENGEFLTLDFKFLCTCATFALSHSWIVLNVFMEYSWAVSEVGISATGSKILTSMYLFWSISNGYDSFFSFSILVRYGDIEGTSTWNRLTFFYLVCRFLILILIPFLTLISRSRFCKIYR